MESPMKPLPASNGPRPHRCEVCQRSFREVATLRKHEQLHRADRPYVCTTCGKSFLWSSNLKVHERVHTGERPYKCKICHRCFTQSNDLRRHERNVHMRGKLYGYKSGRNAAQPDSQQVNLAAYQAFAMQQRALLQQALTYESYLQKAAGVGGVGVSGAAAAAQLFHHSQQQQQQQAAAAMGSGGGVGPPPRGPPGGPDGPHGPAPPPPSSASPRSPLKLEQVTPPATPSDMENELKRGALPPAAHNSSSSTSPHERDLGLASPGRGGGLATSMPLVPGVMHSPPNLLPGHYSAMKTEGLDLVTRAGSLPSFSSFRPMHRSLDGLQALTMGAALGPRGAPAPHHPHMPPASTSSAVNGPLRVSPPHHYHRNTHHHPSPSHLSPVGSEGGGNGGILSPHHHHNLGQHHHHHESRSRHDMMGYHHQHPQHHHDQQSHHGGSGRNSGDGSSSSGHHPDVTTTNGPRRLSSPSSRRSVSPMDTESRRDRRDSDLATSSNADSGRRDTGDVDADGRSISRRSGEYDRNGDVGDAGDRDSVAPDGGDAYHHHRRHMHHDDKDGGPQVFRSRSASRDGYSREPHLERSLSDHLHPDNPNQRQYHRSRSVSPDYRHHHHQQQQHRYPSPHSHLSHHERHFNHLEDELHKRSPPTATITSGSTPGSNNNNNNNSSTPYPCDSVMDLSMSKPPPPTSASPPSRTSSAASLSHDKEVAGVNNNSSSSSAAATIMPPPRTPTSAGATTPTSMHHSNGTLSGLLQLAAATALPMPPQHHSTDGESEPGKRDVTTTSATPTLSGTGADSSIHHCQHCNIFFYDYTMFHLHESLHLPYEDHPFRCPSCGTHCQDKIEFMFHTVWHVKYPHTIPNYAPFRERVLASSSSP